MTDIVWQHVNTAEAAQSRWGSDATAQQGSGHALQSLSLVGCKSMRCCYLGVVPEDTAELSALSHQQQLLQPRNWLPASCHLSGGQDAYAAQCHSTDMFV